MKAKLIAGALAFGLWGGVAGAQEYQEPQATPDDTDASTTTTTTTQSEDWTTDDDATRGTGGSGTYETERKKDEGANERGLTVMLGGGLEGYTGQLAPVIEPGPAWGVTAAIKPTRNFGVELGYSGAANVLDTPQDLQDDFVNNGADMVRNGGSVALTLGLSASDVQPYLLAGVGLSQYSVRGDQAASRGFRSDLVGNVPVGGGIRAHLGAFTADARLKFNPIFSNDFAPAVDDNRVGFADVAASTNYSATLNLGATF